MHELDAIEALHFEQLDPERTLIVRPRRFSFDAVTALVSGVVTGMFLAFATVAALV